MFTTHAATIIRMLTTTCPLITIMGIRTTMVMSVAPPIRYQHHHQATPVWPQPKFPPATHERVYALPRWIARPRRH
ncbi:hypothetical protein [Accumulibacter sp.]|uniref:hypothetical protein n=1 Tax=Accumulibacter sp. TaxID=2053492 RepID=UPI0028C4BE94|nr:hypothetical protein [Accumulibacter sp.]